MFRFAAGTFIVFAGFAGCSEKVDGGSFGSGASLSAGSGSGTDSESEGDSDSSGTSVGTDGATSSTSTTTGNATTSSSSSSSTTGGMGACGNNSIDAGEQCDGGNLNGFDCSSLGYTGGTLACDAVMCTFDTSMCTSGTSGTSG